MRQTMKMNEATFDSDAVVNPGGNGNGHNDAHSLQEDAYQAAYDAGLASGQESGYRQGYQAGFADGFKQAQGSDDNAKSAGSKAIDGRVKRLRGLPCAQCGVSLYSDETFCRSCGTPKSATAVRSERPS